MKFFFLKTLFLIWMMISYSLTAVSKDLGSFGKVYKIQEEDALELVEKSASKVNFSDWMQSQKIRERIENYQPKNFLVLPKVEESQVRMVDVSEILRMDIPNPKGGILYPKGTRINPLHYVFLPSILVFFDGFDPKQVDWFESVLAFKKIQVMVLLNQGKYGEISNKIKKPVYFADARILNRLQVKRLPSIVTQVGSLMRVEEIHVP